MGRSLASTVVALLLAAGCSETSNLVPSVPSGPSPPVPADVIARERAEVARDYEMEIAGRGGLRLARGSVLPTPPAGTTLDPLPADVTPTIWVEVKTPHFLIRTDEGADLGQLIAADLERSYALVLAASDLHDPPDTSRAEVVVFARKADFAAETHLRASGLYRPGSARDPEAMPRIYLYGRIVGARAPSARHEITHLVLARNFAGSLPRWLEEGLAQLYETAVAHDGSVEFGRRPRGMVFHGGEFGRYETPSGPVLLVPYAAIPGIASLRNAPATEWLTNDSASRADLQRQYGLYLGAYAVTQLLMAGSFYPGQLPTILAETQRGDPFEQAWNRHLGNAKARIDDELQRHLRRQWATVTKPFAPPASSAFQARPMTAAEHLSLEVRLAMPWSAEAAERLGARVGREIAAGPWSADLLMWRSLLSERAGDRRRADAELDAALAAHPDDGRLLFARATIEIDRWTANPREPGAAQRVATAAAKLEKAAQTAPALTLVAQALVGQRKLERAVDLARRAVAQDPACGPCHRTLASALRAQGKLSEAHAEAVRAAGTYRHTSPPPELVAEIDQIADELRRAPPTKTWPKPTWIPPVPPVKEGTKPDPYE